ncbi:MAG: hypothetical protein KBG15_06645 [Kofleriaceae bacterium]|nr:hypothetical protein [Kofleriaceae bacterium]
MQKKLISKTRRNGATLTMYGAALVGTLVFGLPAQAAPSVAPAPAALETSVHVTPAPMPAQQLAADATRYAAVQERTPEAAKFEGGSTTLIVGSTTALLLIIIILILL